MFNVRSVTKRHLFDVVYNCMALIFLCFDVRRSPTDIQEIFLVASIVYASF